MRLLEQVVTRLLVQDLGVANVAPVEEVQQVDPATERQDAVVQASIEPPVAPLVILKVYLLLAVARRDILT